MPVCRTCRESKPYAAFSFYQLSLRGKRCRDCQHALSNSHYAHNKSTYSERDRARKVAARALIQSAKEKPCADCKQSYPYYVMEFDHRRGKKEFLISKAAVMRVAIERVQAEIDKCDVVCSNCHAIRTHVRVYGAITPPTQEQGDAFA